ncbi:head GIN domain-containing protein [Sphingomonas soli]|uniref:head GIN domain-containing protein n=1 Tax=Sphingomonas soli TaxID=266127 RepID=UPI00083085C0|nr:head GIN domain-containing protein [Sphingomonas soli]
MRLLTIALVPMLATTAACQSKWEKEGSSISPSGPGASRTYAATGFTGVDLRGSDNVDVKIGSAFSVTAEGDPKVLDQLDIQVVDGNLRIGRKDRSGNWFSHDNGVRVHVVMPALARARVSGSGNLSADRAEGNIEAAVTGSGDLDIENLKGGTATLTIAGSGDLSVKGTAEKLSASIAGSGDISARGLTANSADISIAGSGSLHGTVKGAASVSIVGSGDVELVGGAKCTTNAVGSGEVRCS